MMACICIHFLLSEKPTSHFLIAAQLPIYFALKFFSVFILPMCGGTRSQHKYPFLTQWTAIMHGYMKGRCCESEAVAGHEYRVSTLVIYIYIYI
jgi:hypothetical protein